ncbi:hypothetical protein HPB50_000648 [Hyalomma asiaticum]|uniref:Uncharacterized protein n=1 Tax=Hyalomma asiaticum TaxID=266040 RepID=A0ACB7TCN4_HYAAI|nr:hypothetical protein HPB50_000648 [Hyalomma asiaticum]
MDAFVCNVVFGSMTDQVHHRVTRKGCEFAVIVDGESALGKSGRMYSVFMATIYGINYPGPPQCVKVTTFDQAIRVGLKEDSGDLALTIVDTPGFGDAVDNTLSWQPISAHAAREDLTRAFERSNQEKADAPGNVTASTASSYSSNPALASCAGMKRLSDGSASTFLTESRVLKSASSTSFVARGNDTEYGVSTVSEIKAFVECRDITIERGDDCEGRYLCVVHRKRLRAFCHLIFEMAVKTNAANCNAMRHGRTTQGAREKEPRTHGVEATVVPILQECARVASVQYSLDVLAR